MYLHILFYIIISFIFIPTYNIIINNNPLK